MEKKSKNHQKLQILPERNQILATADFCEKGFFLTSYVAVVKTHSNYSPKRRALREPRKMQLLFRNGIDITADNT